MPLTFRSTCKSSSSSMVFGYRDGIPCIEFEAQLSSNYCNDTRSILLRLEGLIIDKTSQEKNMSWVRLHVPLFITAKHYNITSSDIVTDNNGYIRINIGKSRMFRFNIQIAVKRDIMQLGDLFQTEQVLYRFSTYREHANGSITKECTNEFIFQRILRDRNIIYHMKTKELLTKIWGKMVLEEDEYDMRSRIISMLFDDKYTTSDPIETIKHEVKCVPYISNFNLNTEFMAMLPKQNLKAGKEGKKRKRVSDSRKSKRSKKTQENLVPQLFMVNDYSMFQKVTESAIHNISNQELDSVFEVAQHPKLEHILEGVLNTGQQWESICPQLDEIIENCSWESIYPQLDEIIVKPVLLESLLDDCHFQ